MTNTLAVTFHGVRGSTPCNGHEVARYGGNTSCVSIDVPGERPLLFDMGTGLRYFGLLQPTDRPFKGTCLVSHLHWDHVQGLPFFGPLQNEEAELVVFAPAHGGCQPAEVLSKSICPPLFPIGLDGFPGTIDVRRPLPRFEVGGFRVESAPVPHIGETVGYRVSHSGISVAYVSDHQQPPGARIDDGVRGLCADVDLLIHDAQYTPAEFKAKRDWGHCTVEYAVWLAGEVGARRLALYHHDPSHDDDTIDRLSAVAARCGRDLGVEVFAASEGMTVTLGVD